MCRVLVRGLGRLSVVTRFHSKPGPGAVHKAVVHSSRFNNCQGLKPLITALLVSELLR